MDDRRYLITTADERTWKFDRPVVFLGEWCRVFTRSHIWEKMDAIVAEPYGLDTKNRDADHLEARAIENELLPILCEVLNAQHQVSYTIRAWKVILGSWLRRHIEMSINRIRTLENCLKTHDISGVTILKIKNYSLASSNSEASVWTYSSAKWNNNLYLEILKYLNPNILIEYIDITEQNQELKDFNLHRKKWQEYLRAFIYKCAGFNARFSNTLIFAPDLSKIAQFKLHLALKQFPYFISSPAEHSYGGEIKNNVREELGRKLCKTFTTGLRRIVADLIFKTMPHCYLEGFSSLRNTVLDLSWPSQPTRIFTSFAFEFDEVFKLYAAEKVIGGALYFVGQHGNKYGTDRFLNPSCEEEIADKFINWGHENGFKSNVPGFMFNPYYNERSVLIKKSLLLVQLPLDHMRRTWDVWYEHLNYFDEQKQLISGLRPNARSCLTVRLHSMHAKQKFQEANRLLSFDANIKIDYGYSIFQLALSQSKLVVFSYDSTGMLQTLYSNIPTLAFWQNGLNHLTEIAKRHYQVLVDAKIVHLCPETAAKHINNIWDCIDDWWFTPEVQNARIQFCSRYARESGAPVRELKEILLGAQSDLQ